MTRWFAEFYVKFKFSKSEVLKAVDKSISVSVNLFKHERIGRILQKRTMHHVILSFLTSYSSSSLYEKKKLSCAPGMLKLGQLGTLYYEVSYTVQIVIIIVRYETLKFTKRRRYHVVF